jgi:hypothetical protein
VIVRKKSEKLLKGVNLVPARQNLIFEQKRLLQGLNLGVSKANDNNISEVTRKRRYKRRKKSSRR